MFRDLPTYREYRPTRMPWCLTVPGHWDLARNKGIMAAKAETVGAESDNYDLLSLTKAGVVYRDISTGKGKIPASFDTYQAIEKGDLIMCLFDVDETPRTVGRARQRGMITGAYNRFMVRDCVLAEYVNWFYLSVDDVKGLRPLYRGLRKTVPLDSFMASQFPLPPAEEQAAIVKYLAHANARIGKAITAKRRLIDLLEEQERAIVEALIRGEAEQNQRRTGLPWFSKIPASWELLRVKKMIVGIEQGWSPQCDAQPAGPTEWGVLKAGCSNYGRFRGEENKKLPEGLEARPELEVKHGDLLVSRANTRELVGSAAVALNPRTRLIFSDKTFRLRVRNDRIDCEFLALAMRTRSSRDQIEAGAVGASHSMQNIGQGVIANLWVALPALDVQHAIVSEIHRRSAEVEKVVGKARREIDLLKEFRGRLAADVVTGQVDVSAIAATLPQAPESFDNLAPESDDDLEEALSAGEE